MTEVDEINILGRRDSGSRLNIRAGQVEIVGQLIESMQFGPAITLAFSARAPT